MLLENVTGPPLVGYSVSSDLTVVTDAERETLLGSKVVVERPTVMKSIKHRGETDQDSRAPRSSLRMASRRA